MLRPAPVCVRAVSLQHFSTVEYQFRVSIDDIPTLPVSHIYRHWRNSLNSELVTTTQVLLELISVRDGAFCMPEFDSMSVIQFIECICTNLFVLA